MDTVGHRHKNGQGPQNSGHNGGLLCTQGSGMRVVDQPEPVDGDGGQREGGHEHGGRLEGLIFDRVRPRKIKFT